MAERARFEELVVPLVASGAIPVLETISVGFESAIDALRSVLTGGNFGKQIVDLTR
jgi:NADPH-dependent curcumin reductase CurA